MKYVIDFCALVGLCSTIIVVGFYMGYTNYQPECGNVLAVFTKECK